MPLERTLIILKPDAVQRGLVGQIVARFEAKGLKIVGLKMMQLSDALLADHYSHLADKPFFPEIRSFMSASPVVVVCLEGLDAVAAVRLLCGITKAREAAPGTIRGDFGMSVQANLIHASDSVETAVAEVKRFFSEGELFEYGQTLVDFIYSPGEQK